MKKFLVLCTALTCVQSAYADYNCNTPQPTCGQLGYTLSSADCSGLDTLRCPFDTSKLYCKKATSTPPNPDDNGVCNCPAEGFPYILDANDLDEFYKLAGENVCVSSKKDYDDGIWYFKDKCSGIEEFSSDYENNKNCEQWFRSGCISFSGKRYGSCNTITTKGCSDNSDTDVVIKDVNGNEVMSYSVPGYGTSVTYAAPIPGRYQFYFSSGAYFNQVTFNIEDEDGYNCYDSNDFHNVGSGCWETGGGSSSSGYKISSQIINYDGSTPINIVLNCEK